MPSNNSNKSLTDAKKAKEDEFYTQLSDIEKELKHYRHHFKGKVVYCNCDDPRVSNFFHYFSYNFEKLGLKKLITTCYRSRDLNLFSENDSDSAVMLEYSGDLDGNMLPDIEEIGVSALTGDGDFRSPEAIALLEEADIVVTNPPFSLFREFVAQLIEYEKDFIILGNQNQVATNEIASLITEGKLWQGNYSGDMSFKVPDYYEPRETRFWIDEDGQKWRSLGTGCWYTNLDFAKRHEELILFREYDPEAYPSYVNFDAIEVGRYRDIPRDYAGLMGLPITALSKLSPDQFEIVGFSGTLAKPMSDVVPGAKGSGRFYIDRGNGEFKRMYDRVVIRNKKL
ncbi:adenine-specific methyltransferase EcoRI family protein [Sphingomicrobium arenosum]|uniref:adenine-specific methyltransferase EcoRI family protein n=1 Tax=Sphingomicrobium arenosum TaxID=2233861 RepID=UPI00224096DA|nr:adenine-specific methyltransferase EcoRI family protein [Sphingomicrobium arenosum]